MLVSSGSLSGDIICCTGCGREERKRLAEEITKEGKKDISDYDEGIIHMTTYVT